MAVVSVLVSILAGFGEFPEGVGEVDRETLVEVWMCVSSQAKESSLCSDVVVMMVLLSADAGVRMVPRLATNKMERGVSPLSPHAEVMVVTLSPASPAQPPIWSCNVPYC